MDSQSGFNHAKAVYLVGLRMKVGIIGCGAIAARAHIPAFERAGASVLAVADTDMNRERLSTQIQDSKCVLRLPRALGGGPRCH